MSWERIILDTAAPDASLLPYVDSLFAHQRLNWEAFRVGEAALSDVKTRELHDGDARVIVQSNPGRHKSTHAKVDQASIARRPCFLCPENIPPDEKGIGWGDLVILPNPHPILRRHCTIPSRDHRPQRLSGEIDTLLTLARAVGPEMLAFYNGARCGASCPDHFHFQACDGTGVPVLDELVSAGIADSMPVSFSSFGRSMIVYSGEDGDLVETQIRRTIAALPAEEYEEPMFNVIASFCDGRYVAVLFPRSVHRPASYFEQEPVRIAISPAALEMAGILVVAEPDHFDRVDAGVARRIYEEVSLLAPHPPPV